MGARLGPGELKSALADKAEPAGISVVFVDERGTSSTCPSCSQKVRKPKGRNFSCPPCGLYGRGKRITSRGVAEPQAPDGRGSTDIARGAVACETGKHWLIWH